MMGLLFTRVGGEITVDMDEVNDVVYIPMDLRELVKPNPRMRAFDLVQHTPASQTIPETATYIERVSDVNH